LLSKRLLPRNSAVWQKIQSGITVSEAQFTHFCRHHPHALAAAFFASLLGWLSLMAEFWLMLSVLDIDVSFTQMIVLLTAARVAILLPLPGGLGTLEASQVFAFTAFGFEPASALSFTLLIRARDILLASLGLWGARKALSTMLTA
jgi:uncharacterized protein (TIRG00374 family)